MATKQGLYDQRFERMMKTINHEEPDRAPVLTIMGSWIISYYGTTYQECLKNPEWFVKEVASKIYREMNCDLIMSDGMLPNLEFSKIIGESTRFISADGVSIQNQEGMVMDAEDYPKLIKDPWDYFITDLIPKKYPDITIDKVVQAIISFGKGGEPMTWIPNYFEKEFGLPYLGTGGGYASSPLDMLFDSFRGFKGTLTDLRRRPEQILEVLEALYPISESQLQISDTDKNLDPFPFISTNFHSVTYLSKAQFEKFYAPTYERLIYKAHKAGKKLFALLEGDWTQHYDWLNSLPKNFLIGCVEKDDFLEMKKQVGDNITLAGGMPLTVLKYESKQYCIDYAKRIVNECAPDGGYIFSTDKVIECPGDVNPENYIAVNNFVYEYGGYNK